MASLLLDTFYKIDSLINNGNSINATITFDTGHPIFAGHFPDMPIVPGVCQTQMLGEVLSHAFSENFELKSAASIKFLSVIDPTKNPSLDLIINYVKNEDGTHNVSAQYKWGETVFFKFKGIYTTAE